MACTNAFPTLLNRYSTSHRILSWEPNENRDMNESDDCGWENRDLFQSRKFSNKQTNELTNGQKSTSDTHFLAFLFSSSFPPTPSSIDTMGCCGSLLVDENSQASGKEKPRWVRDHLDEINKHDPDYYHHTWWGSGVTEEQAIVLLDAIDRNPYIKYIEFCECSVLSTAFCRRMGEILKTNDRLLIASLRLNENFGDEGIKLLCEGLEANKTLQEFNIDGTGMTDEGGEAVGRMLQKNSTLMEATLARNDFTAAGFKAVAGGIKHNTALLQMQMELNKGGIDEEGAQAVLDCMEHNKKCIFSVDDCPSVANFSRMNSDIARSAYYNRRCQELGKVHPGCWGYREDYFLWKGDQSGWDSMDWTNVQLIDTTFWETKAWK